jgi:putative methionine-R-sulfoxide reductase with GAF domain
VNELPEPPRVIADPLPTSIPLGGGTLEGARRLEWGLVVVRWFGVLVGIYLATQSTSGALPSPPGRVIVASEAIVGALAVGNLVVMLAVRRATDARTIRRIGIGAFAMDGAALLALVWLSSYTPLDETWTILLLLPLEGAIRYGLSGAASAVGATLVSETAREAYTAARFSSARFSIGAVAFRIGVDAIVALAAGLMARSMTQQSELAARQVDELREVAERESRARRQLSAFHSVILAGILSQGLDETLDLMARFICRHMDYEGLAILLTDGDDVVSESVFGISSRVPGERIPLGRGAAGAVALSGDLLLFPDIRTLARQVSMNPEVKSEMAAPIQVDGHTIGVLDVESRRENAFDGEALLLLRRLADHVGLVVQNERLKPPNGPAATFEPPTDSDSDVPGPVSMTGRQPLPRH